MPKPKSKLSRTSYREVKRVREHIQTIDRDQNLDKRKKLAALSSLWQDSYCEHITLVVHCMMALSRLPQKASSFFAKMHEVVRERSEEMNAFEISNVAISCSRFNPSEFSPKPFLDEFLRVDILHEADSLSLCKIMGVYARLHKPVPRSRSIIMQSATHVNDPFVDQVFSRFTEFDVFSNATPEQVSQMVRFCCRFLRKEQFYRVLPGKHFDEKDCFRLYETAFYHGWELPYFMTDHYTQARVYENSPYELSVRAVFDHFKIPYQYHFPVGPYELDFCLPEKLDFECDGAFYHTDESHLRDDSLRKLGYKIARAPSDEFFSLRSMDQKHLFIKDVIQSAA